MIVNALVIVMASTTNADQTPYDKRRPDSYERSQYQLSGGPPARANAYTDPSRDSDGDGWPDVLEYIADNGAILATDTDQQPTSAAFTAAPLYLGPSTEVHFDEPLRTLARELNYEPVAIYRWVYEHIDYQSYSYWAARKGALATYLSRRGNSWDQCALLISLLRISGIPARFAEVSATPQYPIVQVWLPSELAYRPGAHQHGIVDNGRWYPLVPWLKQPTTRPRVVFEQPKGRF